MTGQDPERCDGGADGFTDQSTSQSVSLDLDLFLDCGRTRARTHSASVGVGTQLSAIPDTLRDKAQCWTGWSRVSALWLGVIARLVCKLCSCVATRKIAGAGPSPTTEVKGDVEARLTNQPARLDEWRGNHGGGSCR